MVVDRGSVDVCAQGIVEQEMETGKHQLRDSVEIDTKNWDQPLIIAEPDVEVSIA
jgi:hypothetical protein